MQKFVNGALVDMTEQEIAARQAEEAANTPTLAAVKDRLRSMIDRDAEAVRLQYITPGAGMAMTYQEKHAQARAVEAMGAVAANALSEAEYTEQFPTLASSIGLEGATLWDCAALVIARYEAWATLSNSIERTRLSAKTAITAALSSAEAIAAYEAAQW